MEPAVIASLADLAARAVVIHHGPRIRLRRYARRLSDDALDKIREEERNPSYEYNTDFYSECEDSPVYYQRVNASLLDLSFSPFRWSKPQYVRGYRYFWSRTVNTGWLMNKKLIARRTHKKIGSIIFRCPVGGEELKINSWDMRRVRAHEHDGLVVRLSFVDWQDYSEK